MQFEDPRDAEDAIRGRDGYKFDGDRLRVSPIESIISISCTIITIRSLRISETFCLQRLNLLMVVVDIHLPWTNMAVTVVEAVGVEFRGTLTTVVYILM